LPRAPELDAIPVVSDPETEVLFVDNESLVELILVCLRPVHGQFSDDSLPMLDQFALSMLSHLPEIPEGQRKQALASGARRQETLSQMEPTPTRKKAAGQNGEHA